jgi:DNA replication protein DnaC
MNWMKPTIITTNYSIEELENKFGDSRLTSRIKNMCRGHAHEFLTGDRRNHENL